MKHVVKIISLVVAVSAIWVTFLLAAIIPRSYTLLVKCYRVSLGCYGLLMVGLMQFPTCPEEALLLQHYIAEAKRLPKRKWNRGWSGLTYNGWLTHS